MGTYTPNYGLYKPDVGETDWGDKVNANFDTIDSEMNKNRSDIDNILNNIIPSLRDDIACNETLISKIKKDVLTIALNVMMHKALLHAETKDFYSIIADVITDEYPNGFKNTFETIPFGVTFDNDGGGTWTKAIKITLTTVPSEYAQYKIVIQSNTMQIYAADGTLKAEYGAETGVASEFWNNVKSDGSDIRVADQDCAQLYFWIEKFDYSGKYAVIWVKIPANTSELYIVYGNANALPSTYNSGENTFEFFENFEDADLSDFGGATGQLEIASDDPAEGSYYLKVNGNHANNQWVQDLPQTFGRGIIIEGYAKHIETAGAIRWGIFESWNGDIATSAQGYWIVYNAGTGRVILGEPDWGVPTSVSATGESGYGVWRKFKLKVLEDKVILEFAGVTLTLDSTTFSNFSMWGGYTYRTAGFDCIKIMKLADPAEFGTAEVITLITTGDFITVTFSFDEGVDKLLITVDTDAQAVYYSTDDGQTWNAIEPDTETPLPETAYSIKWKFEFATYVRGYAFITW